MNDSTDNDRREQSGQQTDFFGWLRGLGIVRGTDNWFTGVAGGIAAKAGIDPLIVRGIFVVLALIGGPAVLIYLAGWLLLPDTAGRIHLEDIIKGRASSGVVTAAVVLACIIVLPVFISMLVGAAPWAIAPGFWGWDLWATLGIPGWLTTTLAWLFWIAVAVVGFFWVRSIMRDQNRTRASHTGGGSARPAPAAASSAAQQADETVAPQTASAAPQPEGAAPQSEDTTSQNPTQSFSERAEQWGTRAEQWGEDASERAEGWAEAEEEEYAARRIGAAQTIITLALALIAAGIAALWVLNEQPSAQPTTATIVIAPLIGALAVIALSLIVAGVRGRYTGSVGFLAWCGVIALTITALLPWGSTYQLFGPVHVNGTSGAPGAAVVAGNTYIDLRDLDELDAVADDKMEVWMLAGNSTVILPNEHPTAVRVNVLAGNIEDQSAREGTPRLSGPFISRLTTAGLPAGADTSEATKLTINLLAGNVTIEGGRDTNGGSSLNIDSETVRESVRDTVRGIDSAREQTERLEREALLRDTEEELELVEWRLTEPGLGAREQRDLERRRDELLSTLDDLALETAR